VWLQEDFVALRKRLELKSLEPVRTHSLTHPSGMPLACCNVLTIRCALLQEDLAVADTSIEKPRSQEEGPCKRIAG